MPGCLDTTPEQISGVAIDLPNQAVTEGDVAMFNATGKMPGGATGASRRAGCRPVSGSSARSAPQADSTRAISLQYA